MSSYSFDHSTFQISNMESAIEWYRKTLGLEFLFRGPLEIKGEETWMYFVDPDHNILERIQWYNKK